MPSSLLKPFPSATPSIWRRNRTWIVLARISVGWKVIVLTLGVAVLRTGVVEYRVFRRRP